MEKYIDRNEALRFMGVKSAPEGRFLAIVEKCEREVAWLAAPRYTYKVFDKDALSGFLLGEDVKQHLEGCEKVIVFAATLGLEIDRYINRLQVLEIASAVAADAVASACIEGFCREADVLLAKEFSPLFLTWRFSPGYGDFPIELQGKLLSLIEADKKIGLHVTGSSMLLPVKSVTALIGVSDTPVKKEKQTCAACNMKDTCAFRKEGGHCGYKSTS